MKTIILAAAAACLCWTASAHYDHDYRDYDRGG